MFFRTLTIFQIAPGFLGTLQSSELAAALAEHPLRPCGALELFTRGFVAPGEPGGPLVRHLGDCSLFALGQEDKILPVAVVNAELQRELQIYAEQSGALPSARTRRSIKQNIIENLLPKAFAKPSRCAAYLDHKDGWLVIDTASRKQAEVVLASLRQALGSLPAMALQPNQTPRAVLTHWLGRDSLPEALDLGTNCELRDPYSDGGVTTIRRQDLLSDEVQDHLAAGQHVYKLGLSWRDRVAFELGEDLVLRKLSFGDEVLADLDDSAAEDAQANADASFSIMCLELRNLLADMGRWFELQRALEPVH